MNRVGLPLLAAWFLGCSAAGPQLTQWEYTGGPYAQNISAVLAPQGPGQLLYAGLETGDVYCAVGGEKSWRHCGTVRSDAVIHDLVADPDSATTLYAATSAGAFVSRNAGATWQALALDPNATPFGCRVIAIDPWSPQNIYIGSIEHGLFRSTDGGTSWVPVVVGEDSSVSPGEVSALAIDLQRPDVVYAAFATAGLMQSRDRGRTWAKVTPTYTVAGAAITTILIHPADDRQLLYGTATGNIFKSSDGGTTWSPTRQGSAADQILSLGVVPEQADMVFAGTGSGMLRSTDFGSSWHGTGSSLPAVPLTFAVGTSGGAPALYAYGEGIGLQRSTDLGERWMPIDQKLGGSTVHLIDSDRSGTVTYAAVGRTVLRFDAERSAWITVSGGLRGGTIRALSVESDSAMAVYASTDMGVFKTVDGGQTWHQTLRRLGMAPDLLMPHPWIATRLFASGEQGIWVSTDRGNSWGQAQPVKDPFRVSALVFSPSNAGTIFGCTESGVISTSDGGFRWGPARFGMDPTPVVAVSIDDEDPQTVYAWGRDARGFRSLNGGLEWSSYTVPWGQGSQVRYAVDRFRPSSILAVVNGSQVYYSDTGGGSWLKVLEKGFPVEVRSLHWNATSGVLMLGTVGRGVFRLSLGNLAEKGHAPR